MFYLNKCCHLENGFLLYIMLLPCMVILSFLLIVEHPVDVKGPHKLIMAEAQWTCQHCTCLNSTESSKCKACDSDLIEFGDVSTLKEDEVGMFGSTF